MSQELQALQSRVNTLRSSASVFAVSVTGALRNSPTRNTQICVLATDVEDAIRQVRQLYFSSEANTIPVQIWAVNHRGTLGVVEHDRPWLG